jgi:hypothetical protein
VQATFWEQFELFLKDFYDFELLVLDETVDELVGKRNERKSGADAFQSLEKRASRLIEQITTQNLEAEAADLLNGQ